MNLLVIIIKYCKLIINEKLMEKFNTFYFDSFKFDKKSFKAHFFYSFDFEDKEKHRIKFEEVIDFKSDNISLNLDWKEDIILDNILFNIHLALWISYYKLYPTKNLVINSWYLNTKQIIFWKKFYLFWLWEFLIKNNINPNWIINFINSSEKKWDIKKFKINWNKVLLPWWWWKDSIVSSVLLENFDNKYDFTPFIFWKIDQIKENTLIVLWKELLNIKRIISKNLFQLNNEWYYNWHVPITWIIAFISQLVCYLYNYRYTILSNERSASEWNTIWKWVNINHQYSKSNEFEKDFNNYTFEYFSEDSKYFSLLGWIYEYKIAEIFSKKAKKYFDKFSSCNRNFVINKDSWLKNNWCNKCEKCCFVYLLLSSFLLEEDMHKIFWTNLFKNKELIWTFQELIWFSWNKPYECVWTYEECLYSSYKAIKLHRDSLLDLPFVLNKIEDYVVLQICKKWDKYIENKLLKNYNNTLIPNEFKEVINI